MRTIKTYYLSLTTKPNQGKLITTPCLPPSLSFCTSTDVNLGLLSFLLSFQQCDVNLDGEIDREEFVKLMTELTQDTFSTVSQGLIISLVVAPSVALATKRATEGVPGVGKVVQKLPSSVYASLVTLIVVAAQSASRGY